MIVPGTKNGEILRGPPSRHLRVIRFDRADSAYSGAHRNAIAMRIRFVDREPGVLERLHRSGDAVVHELVALARFLRLEVLAEVEVANGARETRGERAGVELVDGLDPADAVADVLPTFGNRVTDGGNQAEPCYDDAPFRHGRYRR